MSKLFILSNSFMARTLLFNITYTLNMQFDGICLLKENHCESECFIVGKDTKIEYFSTLDECIEYCDIVMIVLDENVPMRSVEYIELRALKKKCVKLAYPFIDASVPVIFPAVDMAIFNKYPLILNISLGLTSQPYCTEILLNKVFAGNNVNIQQIFTEQTRVFLSQINEANLLNENLSKQLSGQNNNRFDVIVYTVVIDGGLRNLKQWMHFLSQISPDFVILQSDRTFNPARLLRVVDIVKYNLFTEVDFLVQSNYYKLDDGHNLYCNEPPSQSVVSIESVDMEKKLSFQIISKLSLPSGIVAID